jgi:hypothetical protein
MPSPTVALEAETLQRELRTLLGHDKVGVRPYGQHLLIQMQDADYDAHTVARLTNLGLKHYGAAFRTHTGRWEPLPGAGTRTEMAEVVTELLAPYLTPDNY